MPPVAAAYFGPTDKHTHPIIRQVFNPAVGWKQYPIRKRVSGSWVRGLKAEGVTHVALESGGRLADFSVRELLKMSLQKGGRA